MQLPVSSLWPPAQTKPTQASSMHYAVASFHITAAQNFPFSSLTSSRPSLSEASTVAARLNFSAQILAQAADHAKQMHACSKEQFDKYVHTRRFPVGAKVFVSTSGVVFSKLTAGQNLGPNPTWEHLSIVSSVIGLICRERLSTETMVSFGYTST